MITYSNPRTFARFIDWPYGSARTACTFTVETHPARGQRAVRVTLHPVTGRPSAPKALTYAPQVRIVDGDDGRTYIVERTAYGFITVMRSDMKIQEESVHPGDARLPALLALFGVAV